MSTSFSEEIAVSIPPSSYLEVPPQSFKVEYNIDRLPAELLDVNANRIKTNIEYVVAVLVVGVGDHQLSKFSTAFILLDQPVFTGWYAIGFTAEYTYCEGAGETPTTEDPEGRDIYLTSLHGVTYMAVLNKGIVNREITITFNLDGTTISNFTWSNPENLCFFSNYLVDCSPCEGDPCPISEEGDGIMTDELTFEVNFTGENCVRRSEGKRVFVRQG